MYNQELTDLVNKRRTLFSDDEEVLKGNDAEIDRMAAEIWAFIRVNRETLTVEQMMESVTALGAAPSILYDDNGNFTIGGTGFQNLPTMGVDLEKEETTFGGEWFVKPGGWKKTIRQAWYAYLDERE